MGAHFNVDATGVLGVSKSGARTRKCSRVEAAAAAEAAEVAAEAKAAAENVAALEIAVAPEAATLQVVAQPAEAEDTTAPSAPLLPADRRICGACREEKPLAEFTKKQRAKGDAGRCRCCVAASLATDADSATAEGAPAQSAPVGTREGTVAAPPRAPSSAAGAAASMGAHLPSVFAGLHNPTFFSKATGAMINVLAFALTAPLW